MSIPEDLRYTKDHEWVRMEDGVAVVGITHHAQELLGDVVFVELPEVGATVTAEESFGTVESVKAVSDLFAPVSGEVVERNDALGDAPEKVNEDCYESAWLVKIKPTDAAHVDGLLDAGAYEALVAEES